jgi:sulfate adenylyltransferase subunit 1 (EFTu-like GTPase family)
MTITITDESLTGDILNKIQIAVQNEIITVKDVITARVASEVNAYNNKLPAYFNGLIRPTASEKTLNGFKLKNRKKIDIEAQTFIAFDAFQKNGYLILIDDQQAETLAQEVLVTKTTTISFVKLTPLVGG